MGKKKPVQLPFEQNVEYQEWKPSETPDTQALRSMSAMPETLAPALQAQYDRAQERSAQSWGSAYGANIPDVTRRAMQGQERRGMMADYGAQVGQAAFDANNANFQRRLACKARAMASRTNCLKEEVFGAISLLVERRLAQRLQADLQGEDNADRIIYI